MSDVQLSEALLAKLAGWEAMKQARGLITADRVSDSKWNTPVLRGMVREGSSIYGAGLVIKSDSDADNLCTCRDSRQRGIICAHSIAVGLSILNPRPASPAPAKSDSSQASAAPPSSSSAGKPVLKASAKTLKRASADGAGETLELFIVFPPNFADALVKQRVMLYVEGKWRKGRGPLNTLPLDVSFELSTQDAALLDVLENANDGDTPAALMLNPSQFTQILPFLSGHPRITLGRAQELDISAEPFRVPIRAELQSNGEIVLTCVLPQTGIKTIIGEKTTWIFNGRSLQPAALPSNLSQLFRGPTRITRDHVPQFLNADWPKLISQVEVKANFALEDFVLEPAVPTFKLHLDGGLAFLDAALECFYDGKSVSSADSQTPWLPDPQSPTRYRTRNIEAERAAAARLTRHGFIRTETRKTLRLEGENAVLNFFAREYPRLQREWNVTLEQRLQRSAQKLERVEPRFQVASSGEPWFDLDVSWQTSSGVQFAATDVQRLLHSGQSHTRLKNGNIALLDTEAVEEFQEALRDCAPQQRDRSYRINNAQAGFLDATLRQQTGWQVNASSEWKKHAAQQRGQVELPPPLGHLETVLRPYQKQGVAWIRFLRANGFGGILADEMGLGKTLQVLAHISALKSESKNLDASNQVSAPTLVVCPTSLIFNWQTEAAKFTPELRAIGLHGPQRRELFSQIPQADLVITSYALLRRDAEFYRQTEFDTVVLDEAQHIKNRQTQNAQSVKSIRSRHRLVLTGTPIENSVLDLWSIFDFLMPGYLGAAAEFRERYELPIAQSSDAAAQARLFRRLRPFILRRLKHEVAPDLPEKIEQTSFCDLNEQQHGLYRQVLDASRREVLEAVGAQGLAKSRMVVLTALLRLRQICCDLRLLKLSPSGAPEETGKAAPEPESSGKMEMFRELLEEVLDGGHRVLVFSQFTSMLALIGEELAAQKIEFCYLDGATKNRAEAVERFQSNSRVSVFLISLKAGGVGLNLTGADTVIHFDPWWNPAVEAQATDRAHRIGQKNVVTSYKLITRGTVEEKILSLQNRKRSLIQSALGGEEELAQALNWDEIQELLG